MARISNEILANVLLENIQKLEQNTSKICKTIDDKTEQLTATKLQIDVGELQGLQTSLKSLFNQMQQSNKLAIDQMQNERNTSTVWYRWIFFCVAFALIGILSFALAYKYTVDTELKYREAIEVDNYIVPKSEYNVIKGFSTNFEKDFDKYKKWYNEQEKGE